MLPLGPEPQVPPVDAVLNVVVNVWHIASAPVIVAGELFTVIAGVVAGLLTQPEVEVTVRL
jgi:hypothetical protein